MTGTGETQAQNKKDKEKKEALKLQKEKEMHQKTDDQVEAALKRVGEGSASLKLMMIKNEKERTQPAMFAFRV